MKIALCVPTRGRPAQAARLLESVAKTQGSHMTAVLFALQETDPALDAYLRVLPRSTVAVLRDGPTTYAWNSLAWASGADILGLFGDDCVMETPAWDLRVAKKYAEGPKDRLLMVAPADGRGAGMPHYFVSRSWVDALGYLAAPHFWHFYVDLWMAEVAKGVGRLDYDPSIMARHSTFKVAGSGQEYDETYARVRRHTRASDDLMWAATERHRLADIELLKCRLAAS